jgi:hypothetical protein
MFRSRATLQRGLPRTHAAHMDHNPPPETRSLYPTGSSKLMSSVIFSRYFNKLEALRTMIQQVGCILVASLEPVH